MVSVERDIKFTPTVLQITFLSPAKGEQDISSTPANQPQIQPARGRITQRRHRHHQRRLCLSHSRTHLIQDPDSNNVAPNNTFCITSGQCVQHQ